MRALRLPGDRAPRHRRRQLPAHVLALPRRGRATTEAALAADGRERLDGAAPALLEAASESDERRTPRAGSGSATRPRRCSTPRSACGRRSLRSSGLSADERLRGRSVSRGRSAGEFHASSVLDQPQHGALDPLAVDELAGLGAGDHPAQRAADRLAAVVAVEDARVDVGRAADGRRVREVARRPPWSPRVAARLRAVLRRRASAPSAARSTAASTVAFQVRKSLALKSPPVTSFRYSLISAALTSPTRAPLAVGEQLVAAAVARP